MKYGKVMRYIYLAIRDFSVRSYYLTLLMYFGFVVLLSNINIYKKIYYTRVYLKVIIYKANNTTI
jgi:hypothetical protein